MRFKDKVAIVTGAGSGMGEAIAKFFVGEGCKVVIAEINEKNGNKVADEIDKSGGKALAVKVDVSKSKDVENMVQKTIAEFGKIDILIANAGIEDPMTLLHEISEEKWDRMQGVHMKGTFLCCKAVLPHMMKQKSGKIVSFSSVGVKVRVPGSSHYAANKGGIEAMTKSMAVAYGPFNINVNAVAPGFIVTPMWDAFGGPEGEFAKQMLPLIPLGRSAPPIEVARAVAFLVSDDANYITGQILDVNGGLA